MKKKVLLDYWTKSGNMNQRKLFQPDLMLNFPILKNVSYISKQFDFSKVFSKNVFYFQGEKLSLPIKTLS
jgi:hypothetical protein